MSAKAGLPAIQSLPKELHAFLAPVYENLEILTGVRVAPIEALPENATLEEVVAKINEIIARLQ
jgi:hypothetical protein